MSRGVYLVADDSYDLGPIREGIDVNPKGTCERLHHCEVGGRDCCCRHGGVLLAAVWKAPALNEHQRGIYRRSTSPLKRGLGRKVYASPSRWRHPCSTSNTAPSPGRRWDPPTLRIW